MDCGDGTVLGGGNLVLHLHRLDHGYLLACLHGVTYLYGTLDDHARERGCHLGACAGCSLASYDVSESVEVMLMDEVEEVKKVELVQDEVSLGYGDLLSSLQEEELALKELEEIKKNREKDK